ncbi:MAG: hypothetical protein M1834_007295 [Cirrosporium novae-zelandiae]|nr:MAG: hypothetical protein M1834_007295 [Cirrosporium novae-zelandiae]
MEEPPVPEGLVLGVLELALEFDDVIVEVGNVKLVTDIPVPEVLELQVDQELGTLVDSVIKDDDKELVLPVGLMLEKLEEPVPALLETSVFETQE